jgi:hypothetical protein
MKRYKARLTIIIEGETVNDALNKLDSYLALGVSPEDIDIQQISEIMNQNSYLKDDCPIKGLKRYGN